MSITGTFMKVKGQEGASYIPALKELKKDVDKPLIAILTLNTLAHTVGAILVGVQAENMVSGSGYDSSYFGIPFVGIVSGIMTVLILVVSEIIPKTIGATYWQSLLVLRLQH
ncbi:hemolysin [Nonlabens ulvanivorans]|uniref:Hemolysin n=1 Tax=Nonlabens ulvanivorans TaxID=906888 RepID=A0A090WAP0_NONUL|nr:hemolysin [Nonlabens ulvanivorans]